MKILTKLKKLLDGPDTPKRIYAVFHCDVESNSFITYKQLTSWIDYETAIKFKEDSLFYGYKSKIIFKMINIS